MRGSRPAVSRDRHFGRGRRPALSERSRRTIVQAYCRRPARPPDATSSGSDVARRRRADAPRRGALPTRRAGASIVTFATSIVAAPSPLRARACARAGTSDLTDRRDPRQTDGAASRRIHADAPAHRGTVHALGLCSARHLARTQSVDPTGADSRRRGLVRPRHADAGRRQAGRARHSASRCRPARRCRRSRSPAGSMSRTARAT